MHLICKFHFSNYKHLIFENSEYEQNSAFWWNEYENCIKHNVTFSTFKKLNFRAVYLIYKFHFSNYAYFIFENSEYGQTFAFWWAVAV